MTVTCWRDAWTTPCSPCTAWNANQRELQYQSAFSEWVTLECLYACILRVHWFKKLSHNLQNVCMYRMLRLYCGWLTAGLNAVTNTVGNATNTVALLNKTSVAVENLWLGFTHQTSSADGMQLSFYPDFKSWFMRKIIWDAFYPTSSRVKIPQQTLNPLPNLLSSSITGRMSQTPTPALLSSPHPPPLRLPSQCSWQQSTSETIQVVG